MIGLLSKITRRADESLDVCLFVCLITELNNSMKFGTMTNYSCDLGITQTKLRANTSDFIRNKIISK